MAVLRTMDNERVWKKCSYFCTVGNGMENFCLMELHNLKETTVFEVTIGKIFFTSNCGPEILLSLKSVERLFIMILHCKQFLCGTPKRVAFSKLKAFLEREVQWRLCLKQWVAFRSYTHIDCVCSGVSNCFINLTKASKIDVTDNDEHQHLPKKVRLDSENDCLTFRVSCKSTGIIRKLFGPQRLSKFIGYSLIKACGWKVDLKNPQIEVYVHANEDYFTIGLPVVSRPLSERKYLKHIALRSTVCYAMLLCAGDLSAGSILLDPMCGAGTLITEAAVNFQNVLVIGADIDAEQLDKAWENTCNATTASSVIELIHGNVTHLPLGGESVNSIICDLPFGKKFGTPDEVKKLIPLALMEMNRILILNGKVVLLISEGLREYLFESILELNKILALSVASEEEQNEKNCFHSSDDQSNAHSDLCQINLDTSQHNKLNICPTLSFQSDNVAMRVGMQWKNTENHTVKLGEMFASICVFEKECRK